MQSPLDPEHEVVVLGGGPAGAAAASLLAQWGHSVLVLTRSGGAAGGLAESLPPSSIRLLERIGWSEAVDAAGFIRSTGNTVWWGEEEGRVESFSGGGLGYQVARGRLDPLLLALAERNGAQVSRDSSVRSVTQMGDIAEICYEPPNSEVAAVIDRVRGPQSNPIEAGRDGLTTVRARWVLDCTGRTGVVARRGYRQHEEGVGTLAIVGAWRKPGGWALPDPTHTLVESYEDGWAWSVPVSEELRFFTVMVDPRRTEMSAGKDLGPMYSAEMNKAGHLATLLPAARMDSPPWACSASLYAAERYADDGILLVGDAGSFLDPVTSFGVKKALASGWRAAVVAHTALVRDQMKGPAIDLFNTRERLVHASYQDQSASVFREAARQHEHPFWTVRSQGGASEAVDVDGDLDVGRLREDPEILSAFERLRASSSVDLSRAPETTFVTRPTIQGNEVVLEERICTPDFPSGVRFVRDVDLTQIVEHAGEHHQVPDLFEAYCGRAAPVTLPDFLGALSLLLARGILVDQGGRT